MGKGRAKARGSRQVAGSEAPEERSIKRSRDESSWAVTQSESSSSQASSAVPRRRYLDFGFVVFGRLVGFTALA